MNEVSNQECATGPTMFCSIDKCAQLDGKGVRISGLDCYDIQL